MEHQSVLLEESLEWLDVKEDGIYVDCTLGRGGHSARIMQACPRGHLYAFDLDIEAIKEARERLEKVGNHFTLIHTGFENIKSVLEQEGIYQVDGILMDLGVSSPQFDDPNRGFSYRYDARLDMRMDQSQDLDAWQVVNTYDLEDLTKVFKEYGEEPFAYRIASNIVKVRQKKEIDTTFELVDVIKASLPAKVLNKKGHPAKKVFQAIRIEVNQELEQLKNAIQDGLELLAPGGRMVIITFHSLEDRIVKNLFKEVAVQKKYDRRLPDLGLEELKYELISRKPVKASTEELAQNNRAHSAKLRGLKRKEDL